MIFNIQVTSWHETISDNHEIPVSEIIWISHKIHPSLSPQKFTEVFQNSRRVREISWWCFTLPCVWCEDKDHWAGGERVGDEVIRGYWEDRVTSGQISQHNWVIISRVIMLSVRLWPTSQALYQHLHMLVSLSGHWETLHINIWSGLLLLTVSNVM